VAIRAAIRRLTGRRAHLRHGYRVLIRSTSESLPFGGSIVEASVVALHNGRRFRARAFADRVFIIDEMVLGGQYLGELHRLREQIEARATDGMLHVIDAGANVGLFSLFASTVLRPQLRIDGFEPFEENRVLCDRNWRKRGYRVHGRALSNEDDVEARLFLRSSTGATIMSGERRPDGVSSVSALTARLDTMWPQLGARRVDLIKLDIEGAEEDALGGALETIEHYQPFILCSYEHDGNDPSRIAELATRAVPDYVIHDDAARRLLTFEPNDPVLDKVVHG